MVYVAITIPDLKKISPGTLKESFLTDAETDIPDFKIPLHWEQVGDDSGAYMYNGTTFKYESLNYDSQGNFFVKIH